MEPIEYPKPTNYEELGYTLREDKPCPVCNEPTYLGEAPCPDGIAGCEIIHQAFRCFKCGVDYAPDA